MSSNCVKLVTEADPLHFPLVKLSVLNIITIRYIVEAVIKIALHSSCHARSAKQMTGWIAPKSQSAFLQRLTDMRTGMLSWKANKKVSDSNDEADNSDNCEPRGKENHFFPFS